MNHITPGTKIVYENGAIVQTAFVTNLDDGIIAESAPDLGQAINAACDMSRKRQVRELPQYEYPDHLITSAKMQYFAAHGTVFRVRRGDCVRVSTLDAQRSIGKSIFGGGLLLSDRAAMGKAAAERAAAERKNTTVWELSAREREIIANMGKKIAA